MPASPTAPPCPDCGGRDHAALCPAVLEAEAAERRARAAAAEAQDRALVTALAWVAGAR